MRPVNTRFARPIDKYLMEARNLSVQPWTRQHQDAVLSLVRRVWKYCPGDARLIGDYLQRGREYGISYSPWPSLWVRHPPSPLRDRPSQSVWRRIGVLRAGVFEYTKHDAWPLADGFGFEWAYSFHRRPYNFTDLDGHPGLRLFFDNVTDW